MNFSDWFVLLCIVLLIYTYLLYPVLLVLFARIFKKKISVNSDYYPNISILISAHNEEDLIYDCIESIIHQNYTIDKISIIIGSDGSNDNTNNILTQITQNYPFIQVHYFDWLGKNYVLNNLAGSATTDIIFFMDADIRLQKDVIHKLVRALSDNNVGAVIASMKSIGDEGQSSGGFGELLYQKIERIFRSNESKIKSTVNSLGAFYGIKRDLYVPLPDSKVADDFSPLLQVMKMKRRVIFINDAEVLEVRKKSTSDEFNRRIRASSSAMSSLSYYPQLLSPHYGWTSFFMWSHRMLRWATPIFLLLILFLSFFIHNHILFCSILVFQLFLYFGALIGIILEKFKINLTLFKVPVYAINMNLGFLLAIIRIFESKINDKWERT